MANVTAPYPPWSPAVEGYNATLGRCPIAGASFGVELFEIADLDVGIFNRSTFKYCKSQTSTLSGQSYTRQFNLNVTSIMFSATLLGKGIPFLHGDFDGSKLYPILGFGLGSSNLLITNFRTTGLPSNGDSSPYPSFNSENQYTACRKLTATILAGFEFTYDAKWAFGTGYRWFNAGCFNGPRYLRTSTGAAADLGDDVWTMRCRLNEWFLELRYFI